MQVRTWLRWSPLIGLILGIMLASWVGWRVAAQNQTVINENFELFSQRAVSQIARRMELYEYGLRGARGAIIAAGGASVDRTTFARYAASRDIAREFPGARGFGFIRRVPVEEEAAFLRAAKQDGWPNFAIRQLTPHAGERFVIQYIEPVRSNMQAVGLDIASEDNRRAAALRALRTGKVALTDPITLVQADGKQNQGFLVLLPVYRDGAPLSTEALREAAGLGWAYAPLTIDEVLADFDYYEDRVAIRLRTLVSPQTPAGALYTSQKMDAPDSFPLVHRQTLQVFGRPWEIEVQARPTLVSSLNLTSPWWVFAVIVILSALGAAATYYFQALDLRAQRMEADATLHEADTRYRQLVDGIKDYAIIQLDPMGYITGWNTGAERIKGYASAEILGQHISVFYPPEDLASGLIEQKLEDARRVGYANAEGWRLRKDGSRFWGSVTLTPIYDDRHHFVGYSKITRDLSERREQEQELNRLLALHKAILHHAGVAIIATQMDGKITLFNPSAERLLGYAAEEVLGKLTPKAFHLPQELAARAAELSDELGVPVRPGLEALGAKAMRGQNDSREWTYVTKTGEHKPVLLSITGLFDASGTPLGSLGLAADLGDQKRQQAELERAREVAERANQAKSSFLANMSHEIRTPMNGIMGMTQLALQGNLPAREKELLGKALAASKALLLILNDILDYSKIEAGHMQLEQRDMALETVISSAVSLFTHQAEQKGLEMLVRLPNDLPRQVRGDPLRLTQVLSNLLGNAVKFTAQGTITVHVRTRRDGPGRCRVRFSVVDTGIGMNAPQIEALFRPFSQADVSITRRYGGTGLGLSISKRLVELMRGELAVRSVEGGGSEFYFELDFPETSAAGWVPGRPAFSHALVVDDQIGAAYTVQAVLQSWGIAADCADSAPQALDRLRIAASSGAAYDLLLTDWKMPAMDGVELIDRVNAMVEGGELPLAPTIMMVSAYARHDLLPHIADRRVAGLLNKPVLPSELYNLLTGVAPPSGAAGLGSREITLASHAVTAAEDTRLHGRRVLLVEDNQINQEVAASFLGAAGLQVSIANHGLEALERLRQERFDIILMDMHMPVMDGLEATHAIRQMPGLQSLPIVAMTAAVMSADREACQRAGMNDFLAKPLDPELMLTTLHKWLSPASTAQPASRYMSKSIPEAMLPWAAVEDLDVKGGLARMAGEEKLYIRLLGDFAQRAPAMAQGLRSADRASLHALIHKLKGEAGTLGLSKLYAECQSLEKSLRESTVSPLDEPIRALADQVQRVASQILEVAVATPRAHAASTGIRQPAMDRARLAELLGELPSLLRQHMMQATLHSQQILEMLEGMPGHARFLPVHGLIMNLQFSAAVEGLAALPTDFWDFWNNDR